MLEMPALRPRGTRQPGQYRATRKHSPPSSRTVARCQDLIRGPGRRFGEQTPPPQLRRWRPARSRHSASPISMARRCRHPRMPRTRYLSSRPSLGPNMLLHHRPHVRRLAMPLQVPLASTRRRWQSTQWPSAGRNPIFRHRLLRSRPLSMPTQVPAPSSAHTGRSRPRSRTWIQPRRRGRMSHQHPHPRHGRRRVFPTRVRNPTSKRSCRNQDHGPLERLEPTDPFGS
mmetsp:Transcript_36373/g.82208  ORF Transcript_36373/g.82208 Transcript_36373/m.82208 type:complete len:228 (+) Transcript_36373:461-1144(+)